MVNIKEYRKKELKGFIIANILVILYLSGKINFNVVSSKCGSNMVAFFLLENGFISSMLYSLSLVFDCLISDKMKRRIVFWNRPLPGETIFSKLRNNDSDNRFSSKDISDRYRNVYDNMPIKIDQRKIYENREWYAIYRKYEDEEKTKMAQKDYLMCRDMTVSVVVLFCIYVILAFLTNDFNFKLVIFMYLSIMYFVSSYASNVKGRRFVENVIVCDIHNKHEDSDVSND